MTRKSIILRDINNKSGSRYMDASLSDDGTLTIEGQDLGGGVQQLFGTGNYEYEWAWTIQSSNVPKLRSALDAGEDVLAALAARFSKDAAANLKSFLDDQAIPYESWSRIGD
jgi:hypothetical protein